MLTIVTWLWQQPGFRTTYTAETVLAARDMVKKHYHDPHRFVCVTDMNIPGIETIPLGNQFADLSNPTWKNGPSCYRRLIAFKADAEKIFGKRILSLDLDVILFDDVTSLWNRKEPVVFLSGESVPVPYCGAMWLLTAGSRPQVWNLFDPIESPKRTTEARLRGSDQAWFAYVLGRHKEATWPCKDEIITFNTYVKKTKKRPIPKPPCKIMFFNGNSKPWDKSVRMQYKWVKENYPYEQR